MSDEAVGIALLDWDWSRPSGYLYFVARHKNGRHSIEYIPVIGHGANRPEDRKACWTFKGDAGEWLDMTPSVRMVYDGVEKWHNTLHWRVRHRRLSPELIAELGPITPTEMLRKLNLDLKLELWVD